MREPDPVTFGRVRRLFAAVHSMLDHEITSAWLARTLVLVDGGPMLDAPRLGPALRAVGFRPVRRRLGNRRINTWLQLGAPPPCVGRPRASRRTCPVSASYERLK